MSTLMAKHRALDGRAGRRILGMVVGAAALVGSAWGARAREPLPATPRGWTGRNRMIADYYVAPGYPAYATHPRYLGELRGSWPEIGEQYGERAGDLIRYVFEGYYMEAAQIQGSTAAVLDYLHQVEAYDRDLIPEALELMRGIARGAGPELERSPVAPELTSYEKILVINNYFGLLVPPGATSPDLRGGAAPAWQGAPGCSGAVILGSGTKDGKAIHTSSEDQHFFPEEYLVAYVARPTDASAHLYTMTTSAGEIGSEEGLNDRGVVVSGYAGGHLGIGRRRAGLDWQMGVWYASAFSNSAEQAVRLLTVGRPEYRARSGRKIVIGKCSYGANWLVSDRNHAAVVESIPADADNVARYAVRRPGDLGEKGYLVTTNDVEAKDSYNERNQYDPGHPMRQHGSAFDGPAYGLGVNPVNGTRYLTLTWLIRRHYGSITPAMVEQWRAAHYVYDREGRRHDTISIPGAGREPAYLWVSTLCNHSRMPGGIDGFKGANTYVSVSVPADRCIYRVVGRPCEWVGPWDAIDLRRAP